MANASNVSTYQEAYTTFSGADIKAVIDGFAFGNLISCSWSVTREKAPIYVMGVKDPVSMSRGKRGIAGTMTMQNFDRDALDMIVRQDETRFSYTDYASNINYMESGWGAPDPTSGWFSWMDASTGIKMNHPAYYADHMPPFDITLTYVNEYGNIAVEQLFGIEILNEGKGVHIDDMAIETAMTFICRGVGKLRPVNPTQINALTSETLSSLL